MVLTGNARSVVSSISRQTKRHIARDVHHIITELHKHALHITPGTAVVILCILLALLGLAYLGSRNR